jgi:cytochrome c551/c552
MKKAVLIIFTLYFFSSFKTGTQMVSPSVFPVVQEENGGELIKKGKEIFLKNQCSLCHKEKTEGLAPALMVINSHYKGDKEKLIKFFKREADPIVLPESFGIMAANLFKTKRMSQEELNALASYVLSIK